MSYWEEYLGEYDPRAPPFAGIIGDIGQGKTAAMASIAEEIASANDLDIYMIGTKNELQYFPKTWHRIDPYKMKVPKKAVLCGDDLHKYYHARDWADGKIRDLETLARERGHTETSLVVTTQVSRVIDVNLLNIMSCLIIKKPSLMMAKYDRGEIAPLIRKADAALPEDDPSMAYIVSNAARFEGVISGIPLPTWWSDEASTLHKDNALPQLPDTKKPLISGLTILKTIGRLAR